MAEFETFTGTLDSEFEPFTGDIDKPKPPKGIDLRKELVRQLGLTARAGVHGVTGVPGAAVDAITGLANTGMDLYHDNRTPTMSELVTGKQKGPRFNTVSSTLDALMDKAGLPSPRGGLEQVVQFGATTLAGAGDPAIVAAQKAASSLAPAAFQSATKAAKADVAKELHEAGYRFTPSQLEGGVTSRTLEGIGGKSRIAQNLELSNQNVTQELARKALGLPQGTPLTDDVLKSQAKVWIDSGYEPVRNAGTMTTGRVYRQALDSITNKYQSKSFPADTQTRIVDRVNSMRVRQFDAKDAIEKISQLRAEASDQFKPGGDTNYGNALRGIAKAIEDNIELNLSSSGRSGAQMLANFREARKMLAKNYAVRDMLIDPETGIVSTVKARSLHSSGVPLTGELKTIAKAGSPVFAAATRPPIGGAVAPITVPESVLAGGAGLAGASVAGPFGAGMAAFPFVRAGARGAATSNAMQNQLVNRLVGGPSLFGAPAQRVGAATIPPLFSQGEQ